jgi:hypothetical protein
MEKLMMGNASSQMLKKIPWGDLRSVMPWLASTCGKTTPRTDRS